MYAPNRSTVPPRHSVTICWTFFRGFDVSFEWDQRFSSNSHHGTFYPSHPTDTTVQNSEKHNLSSTVIHHHHAMKKLSGSGWVVWAPWCRQGGEDAWQWTFNGGGVMVTPSGIRTPDRGEGLSIKCAGRECSHQGRATMLKVALLHARGFVHRDLRSMGNPNQTRRRWIPWKHQFFSDRFRIFIYGWRLHVGWWLHSQGSGVLRCSILLRCEWFTAWADSNGHKLESRYEVDESAGCLQHPWLQEYGRL